MLKLTLYKIKICVKKKVIKMNKAKILGAVITTAIAMTGICTELSQNVISHSGNMETIKAKTIETGKKEGCKYEKN